MGSGVGLTLKSPYCAHFQPFPLSSLFQSSASFLTRFPSWDRWTGIHGDSNAPGYLQEDMGEVYDMVNTERKSGVSVRALRTMWDDKRDNQRDAGKTPRFLHHSDSAQPPLLPPKSGSRKLTGTVSVDALQQVRPDLTHNRNLKDA